MQISDKEQFLKVMNGMAAMRKAQLIPEVLDLWWGCMADWTIEDFKAATIEILKRTAYMPCPKDFEDLRRAGRMTAGEAWDMAVGHAASSSYRQGPTGSDQVDQCVRMIGGYSAIAMCEEEKLHFLERRFCEHYETLDDANSIRDAVPQIAKPDWLTLAHQTASGTFKRIGQG
jgi:hypothetical protein